MRRSYLDWAAAAPVTPAVMRSYRRALTYFGNPSSPHSEGRDARALLEDARVRIARLASVKADAVLFTSGATEANALALLGLVRASAVEKPHVLYLPSAHASTRGAMEMLKREGVDVEPLTVSDAAINLEHLRRQVREKTVLVALEAVCGETGTRFDTRGVWRTLESLRLPSRPKIHVDASQLPLVESFELTRLGADTLSLDAQKVGAVRGIGVLIAPRHIPLAPVLEGGGQERGVRPGTESPALAQAFALALEEAHEGAAAFSLRAAGMRTRLLAQLEEGIEGVERNGGKAQAPHILNISLMKRDTDYLATLLDEAGFAVSTRSACATDSDGSVAVLALHGDRNRASATLRISWGPSTEERALTRCATALVRAVRFLDKNAIY